MERRGVPSAAVAVEKLARSVGMAMAMSHGIPDYPIVMIPMEADIATVVDGTYFTGDAGQKEIERLANEVAQVWLRGSQQE